MSTAPRRQPALKPDRIDPITTSVIQGALENIAIEMGYKLMRMSYSSIIRESEDFGAALVDAEGRGLAESAQSTPLQSGPIPGYVRGVLKTLAARGDQFRPGDVVMHNDAYSGASHGPDVAFIVPVFVAGRLIGFAATTAHHLDIGALSPGSCGIVEAIDAYAEGLQFKAIKVYDRGVKNEMVWQIVRDNIRASDLVVGDMDAQVAAARIGAERMAELVERYGLETFEMGCTALMDHAERLMRQAIAKLPDGVYRAETAIDGYLDSDDPSKKELPIVVTITKKDDSLVVDLTGTAPQVPDRPINMPLEGTADIAIWLTIRSVLLDTEIHGHIPVNDPADHHRGAQGVPGQPDLPRPHHRPLLPGQPARRHGDEGTLPRHAGQCLGRHRQPQGDCLLGAQGRDALGAHGDLRGLLWRPAGQGRHGRRRHALRQHPQQPDRGHRDPPALARAALRTA
jgi:N-methylhydantoinase B